VGDCRLDSFGSGNGPIMNTIMNLHGALKAGIFLSNMSAPQESIFCMELVDECPLMKSVTLSKTVSLQ
jgi:hypothetical protein